MNRESVANQISRCNHFINAVRNSQLGTTIAVFSDYDDDAEPLLRIKIGRRAHILYLDEARRMADAFEGTMNQNPNEPEVYKWPNIIMGIRAACDKVERDARSEGLGL